MTSLMIRTELHLKDHLDYVNELAKYLIDKYQTCS